jgi:hypothetical protein
MTDSTPRVESEGVPLKDSEWVLEEAPIPFIGWYFAFRIDPQATLPFLRKDGLSAFREQSNIYVGYLESVRHLSFRTCTARADCLVDERSLQSGQGNTHGLGGTPLPRVVVK